MNKLYFRAMIKWMLFQFVKNTHFSEKLFLVISSQ